MRLQDKVAIVTGAGRGIGRAIALAYADEGARVVLAARTAEQIAGVQAEIEARGGAAIAVSADVSHPEQVDAMVERAVSAFGTVDILVNNAAVAITKTFLEHTLEDWERTFAVNCRGLYLCTHRVLPIMLARNEGRIINISSMVGKKARADLSAYSASKFAVIGLTEALADGVKQTGVNVNAICPGWVVTEMAISTLPDADTSQWLQPQDLAHMAVFLASDEGKAISGSTFEVFAKSFYRGW